MTLLKIARMGHPVLLQTAEVIADPTARNVGRLLEDMVETMEDAAGVGLAARCQPHTGGVFHSFDHIFQKPADIPCRGIGNYLGGLEQHRVAHASDFEQCHEET